MIWSLYAIFYSLFKAAFAETNRIFKVDSLQLSYLTSLVATLLMVPLVFFMVWPEDSKFYFAAVMISLIMTAGLLMQLDLATQKMGRVSSIYMPFEALAAILIWIIVSPPDVLESYIGNHVMTGGVALSFLLCTAAMLTIRKNDINAKSFLVTAPVGCTFAVAAVVTKMVMPDEFVMPTVLTFVFISYVVMTLVLGVFLLVKQKASGEMFKAKMLKAGSYAGVFSLIAYISFVAALAYAPNPGFVIMIAMGVPAWLLAYHKSAAVEDEANPVSAIMMVLGIILLIAVTA